MKYKDSLKFKENIGNVSYTSKRRKRRKEEQEAAAKNAGGWIGNYLKKSKEEERIEKLKEEKVFKRILLTEKTIKKMSPGIWGMITGTTHNCVVV